jgi:nucleotidyltransferase/DNA polymerase involved in DNA repair
MAYSPPNQQEYEDTIEQLLHMSMDQLIDIGARLNLHSDILSTHEIDEDGETTELPDVHPERLLKAQLGVEGAEEELDATQSLIKHLSHILIVRRVRQLITTEQ